MDATLHILRRSLITEDDFAREPTADIIDVMNKRQYFLFYLGCVLFIGAFEGPSASNINPARAQKSTKQTEAIALIHDRFLAQYITGDCTDAGQYLVSQTSDGSWPDIDYADRSLNWVPQKHLDRLKQMAIAYNNGKSPFIASILMRDAIARGLVFWYRKKPAADDWWHNEIGQQLVLEPILILMDGAVPGDVVQNGTTYLHDPVELSSYKVTGQNLIWCAGEQFVRGVLRRSEEDINQAVHAMESVDTLTADAEGIQYDHSFHQHGRQLYNGGTD